ncbi:mechanosensitive ion channel [uncultured Algimonas sp.]|uniref:mechanosensitive ion channel n=1 Tax=uncultured Algimonas sp. TaxID=1547920 RepID=UPI002616252F|nr:mechanosensitive ion channel [uncultured Algimonas sp.]
MDQINQFMAEMPGWLAAVITAVVAIVIAFIVKIVITTIVNKTRLGAKARTTGGNLGSALGRAGFWLTLLFFVPPFLGFLELGEYGRPIDDMFRNIWGFLPNLIGAALILGIGYVIAKIAQNATTTTLRAMQIDNLMTRFGVTDATGSQGSLASAAGTLIFILVIVPVLIGALGVLDIDEISIPLSNLLQDFLDFIPELISAAVVLALAIFIGRFVSNFLKGLLPTLGFDNSINTLMSIDDGKGLRFAPSVVAGNLAFLIIAVLGLTAALDILGIEFLSATFDDIVAFGGQLLRAAVLIMIGVFLANFISRIMAGMISPRIAELFRYVAILIFVFLGLSSLDPAGDIIPTAFGALVIGTAVAGSLAFGLGGRDWAGQVLQKLFPPKDMSKPVEKTPAKPAARKVPVRRKTPPKV